MIDTDDLSASTEQGDKKAVLHTPAVTTAFERLRMENLQSDDPTVFKFGFDGAYTTQVSASDLTDDAADHLTEWALEATAAGGRVRRRREISLTDVVDGDRSFNYE